MNYQNVLKLIRAKAKEYLQLELILDRKAKIGTLKTELTQQTNELETLITELKTEIARNDYNLSRLESTNPDYETLKTEYTNDSLALQKEIDRLNNDILKLKDDYSTKIKHQQEKIMDIENGKTKVSMAKLNEVSKNYLVKVIDSSLSKLTLE